MITGQVEGTGGRLRLVPEHFAVEEVPLFAPSEEGPHVFVRLTRTGRTTREVVLSLSRVLGCVADTIGYAGLKDKDAVVTQTFSVFQPQGSPEELGRRISEGLGVQVHEVSRHDHKLKQGKLQGNRFTITVSGCSPDAQARLVRKMELLEKCGVPNYFGEQRFGHEGANVERGLRVLRGRERPEPWLRKLLVSSLQSELFNQWLAIRIQSCLFERLLPGDLARRMDSGALFLVLDEKEEQDRFESRAIDYTGPVFGREMREPTGRPAELEKNILLSFGAKDLERRLLGRGGPSGTRRLGRFFPGDWSVSPPSGQEESYTTSFVLPPGSYATVLMRELMEGQDFAPAGRAPGADARAKPSARPASVPLPRLVILDRDGVLNEDSDNYVISADEWEPIPGSLAAVAKLTEAGCLTAVASNQSGIGRGYFGYRELEQMHTKLRALLGERGGRLDRILICPHTPEETCACRKPSPGMLLEILKQLQVDPADAVFVGDSLRDVEAARAAGVRPLLVLTGKGIGHQERRELPDNLPVYADLAALVDALLAHE